MGVTLDGNDLPTPPGAGTIGGILLPAPGIEVAVPLGNSVMPLLPLLDFTPVGKLAFPVLDVLEPTLPLEVPPVCPDGFVALPEVLLVDLELPPVGLPPLLDLTDAPEFVDLVEVVALPVFLLDDVPLPVLAGWLVEPC